MTPTPDKFHWLPLPGYTHLESNLLAENAALTMQLARFAAAIERLEKENACLKTQLLSPLDEAHAQLTKVMHELQQALDKSRKEE